MDRRASEVTSMAGNSDEAIVTHGHWQFPMVCVYACVAGVGVWENAHLLSAGYTQGLCAVFYIDSTALAVKLCKTNMKLMEGSRSGVKVCSVVKVLLLKHKDQSSDLQNPLKCWWPAYNSYLGK